MSIVWWILTVGMVWWAVVAFNNRLVKASSSWGDYNDCFQRSENPLPHGIVYLTWAIFAAAMVSPLFYEYPNWPLSYVVTRESRIVTPHRFGAFAWEFGNGYANIPLGNHIVRGSVALQAEDSRITTINYTISIRMADPLKFHGWYPGPQSATGCCDRILWQDLKTMPVWENPGTVVEQMYHATAVALLRFHRWSYQSLQDLDNPFDSAQQQKFKQLMESTLGPELESQGLAIECQQFTLE